MPPPDFERLRHVFNAAAELSGDERERRLAEACGHDPDLERQVRELLRHHDAPPALLAAPAPNVGPPREIGSYRLGEVLGAGGVGVVYRAEQQQPRRAVALKVLQFGALRPEVLERFAREAELLGRLQHPGIAQVYEAGTFRSDLGEQPYFAMELVDGETVTAHAARRALGPAARCELIVQVCRAVQHAHERGIVHRDLKPANLLVAEPTPGQPIVKVLDFGVARATEMGSGLSEMLTQEGQMVGTLPYMSPEQVAGTAVDGRADVYSTGAVLYELLTGRVPLDLGGLPLTRVLDLVTHTDPAPVTHGTRGLDRDLDAILATALAKDPDARYPSAAALAEDLLRHVEGRPILARQPGPIDRARRFVSRHRGPVAGIAVAFLALAIAVVAISIQARRAGELARSEQRSRYHAEMNLASAALAAESMERIRQLVDGWAPANRPGFRGRGWEWHLLHAVSHAAERVLDAPGVQHGVFWLPGGPLAAHDDTGLSLWDLTTGRRAATFPGTSAVFVQAAASPDGRSFAVTWNDSIRIHDLTGAVRATLPVGGSTSSIQWAPDRDHVGFCDHEHRHVHVWNAGTGRPIRVFEEPAIEMAFGADGRIARALDAGVIRVGLVEASDTAVDLAIEGTVRDLAFSPDGQRIAAATTAGTARVWDAANGESIAHVEHDNQVFAVAWSGDGSLLASGGRDHQIRVLDVTNGSVTKRLGHGNAVWGLAYQPAGRRLVSASEDGSLRIWAPESQPAVRSVDLGSTATNDLESPPLGWDPDGGLAVTLAGRETAHRIDTAGRAIGGHPGGLQWNATGHHASAEPTRLWLTPPNGEPVRSWAPPPAAGSISQSNGGIALAPRGGRVAIACRDTAASVWVWDGASDVGARRLHVGWTPDFAWHPDGVHLALCTGRTVRLVDSRTGAVTRQAPVSRSTRVAWSPDGRILAIVDHRMRIHLWQPDGGVPTRVLRGHTRAIRGMDWHPDGGRLATASNDRTVKLWDIGSAQETLTLQHDANVFAVAWRADGRALASASDDGAVKIWDASAALGE